MTSRVADARAVARLRAVAYPAGKRGGAGDGATMFGLRHPAVLYLLEQLHRASAMKKHKFQYREPPHRMQDDEVRTGRGGLPVVQTCSLIARQVTQTSDI